MAEEQRVGDYPATITPIGYVEVSEEIWNVDSLLGCVRKTRYLSPKGRLFDDRNKNRPVSWGLLRDTRQF